MFGAHVVCATLRAVDVDKGDGRMSPSAPMQWTFDWLAEARIARARTTGRVTFDAVLGMIGDGMAFAQGHQTRRLLVDHTASEPAGSTLDIYRLPPEAEARGLTRDFRLAIVAPNNPKHLSDFTFYETRAQNAGFLHRVFTNERDAIAWLTGAASD